MPLRAARTAILLVVVVGAAYLATGRTQGAGDTLPARYLPWSILRHGTFTLDAFPALYGQVAHRAFPVLDGVPYFLREHDGHYVSAYSPGPGLAALPVYAPAVLAGLPPEGPWPARLEKLAAALLTALSAAILFLALEPLTRRSWALVVTGVYAFATSSLSVSSQGLWEHGPSQLFVALWLLALVRARDDRRWLLLAGLAMGGAAVMRATNALLVLPAALWLVWRHRRGAVGLVGLALLGPALLAAYNLRYLGALAGGGTRTRAPIWAYFVQTPFAEGLPGVLVSPGRGLFVYSPVLLFSIAGAVLVWRGGPPVFRAVALGPMLVVLLVSKWFLWWGGHCWGPRLLADTLPVLGFLLYPLGDGLARRAGLRALFAALTLVSVAVHALGALAYDGRWDAAAEARHDQTGLWSWRDGPLAFYGGEVVRAGAALVLPGGRTGPTSADSPERLRARLVLGEPPREVMAGDPLTVDIRAANTGGARWLARAPGDRGVVLLGWWWLQGGAEVGAGRIALPGDVDPGESAHLQGSIPAPAEPGAYTLVLDLVSEHIAWFAQQGGAPLAVEVVVQGKDLARLVAPGPEPAPGAPTAAIALDRERYRAGGAQAIRVRLSNPGPPGTFDAYLLLADGGGRFFPFDGRVLGAEGRWNAWAKALPMPARAEGHFEVPLTAIAPGSWAWHVILTETGSSSVAARARAPFRVDP